MLSEEQINRLYKFCTQHYVRYYDVQIELVDHLANAIETKMDADKNIDFETALSSVYAGFGIMGFSKIVTQKTESANRNVRKMRWQYFKEYFTIPKIALTILLATFFTSLYFLIDKKYLTTVFMILIVISVLSGIGFVAYSVYRYKSPKKELLCLKNANTFTSFGLLCQVPNWFNLLRDKANEHIANYPIYYILIVVYCMFAILFSVACMRTYMKIEENARENYPLAFQ